MTKITGTQASANTQINTETKKQEIKPNDTGLKNDKVEISKKNKLKKVGLFAAATSLIGTTASLIYMIGRNPAKAAKVLRGNYKYANEAYAEGNRLAEELLQKKGEFKTSLNEVLNIFQKPEHKTVLHQDIAEMEAFFAKHNIVPDKETDTAIKTLKQNLEQHCTNIEQDLLAGREVKMYERIDEFGIANKRDFSIIQEFIQKQNIGDSFDLSWKFSEYTAKNNTNLIPNIGECPAQVLPNNGVFYHGTMKQNKVYKEGFTPFASNQLENSCRELGAGVYLTPDVRVAAYFTNLVGSIIPVQLGKNSKIALITEESHKALSSLVDKLQIERMPKEELEKLPQDVKNALHECLFQKVIKEAGYDAAYIPKGVKAGGGLFGDIFGGNINEAIGTNQSQLVVFSPEKIEVAPRGLKDRICDLKEKFSAMKSAIKYQQEHPLGF
ncbi:MAG: hypothetical protein NC200_06870 [Candidatus Gastranaerophilales bacterium]|nr:hypothetical protein [Candidatus Gastranaerophilales bacterium]